MRKRQIKSFIVTLIIALLCAVLSFSFFGCYSAKRDPLPDGTPSVGTGTDDKGGSEEQTPSAENPDKPNNPPVEVTPDKDVTPAWQKNFDLPDGEQALLKLNELYGGAEKVFLLQKGKVARMPCPQGEAITLNMTYEVGDYTKLVLEDSIAEFNEVFAVINPNYKFVINYSPTESDLQAKYSVRMAASDKLAVTETSQVFGLAHISYYANFTQLGDFGITMKTEVLNNGSYLMTTFKHELMHLLGAGDAYNNDSATKDTVMQRYTVNGYRHLSSTDVAFLDTLYRNPEFKDDEKIGDFIESYEEKNAHTESRLTAAVYRKLVGDLDAAKLVEQAADIGYKDVAEFSKAISGGIVRNERLGESYISFKEIEYAEPQSETYFGSIDPSAGKYWHGRQTNLGNSMGTAYTDYGSGVIYATPNGTLTILIQTGDYILTMKLIGGFKNFSALSLSLWHISK